MTSTEKPRPSFATVAAKAVDASAPTENGKQATTAQDSPFYKADSANCLGADYGRDSGYGGEHSQAVFAQKRARLSSLLDGTQALLRSLDGTNGTAGLTLRYPASALQRALAPKHTLSRSNIFEDSQKENGRDGSRDHTPRVPTPLSSTTDLFDLHPLRILSLDLASQRFKGTTTDATHNSDSLVTTLLQNKIAECTAHLDRLRGRIMDIRSKVLVTGDLNAGKSTFVNAVLRREVVPDDQQPCTALFAEVVDALQNEGVEEVHGIRIPEEYDRTKPDTFSRFDFRHLRTVVEENEEDYELLKIYCKDNRSRESSLLHNGVVDISLIDSPGLNIDSIKTTALFSQQEEIDVIVFVVNAENHFTLSGREFLTTAGKEKAYIFIVVNRFDQIKRKDRCRREILAQIQQISPATYEDADTLVHFVSAQQTLLHNPDEPLKPDSLVPQFVKLEESLRSFILEKRSRSKLAPAKIYLSNLLTDVCTLAQYNSDLSDQTATKIATEIEDATPAYDRMLQIKKQVLDDIDRTIDDTAIEIQEYTNQQLAHLMDHLEAYADSVRYHGPFYIWQYARDVRRRIRTMASHRVRKSEENATQRSRECLVEIANLAQTCMTVPPQIDIHAVDAAFPPSSTSKDGFHVAVPWDEGDLLTSADRLELVRDYAPSVAVVVAGLVGYSRGVAMGVVRRGTARLAFAGITIAGVGYFLYTLSSLSHTIQTKLLRHFRTLFTTDNHLIEDNVTRISKTTKRSLHTAMSGFQTQFMGILSENERRRRQWEIEAGRAKGAREFYEGVRRRASGLGREVDAIDV
ncbi:uncharacterized protein EV422DRAFT_335216 [Fimicolochytrium jonesii]|uniref:uncharacterized protein n=1 Tax=Fimicolochytrium jonesii TaxID=1396493 RepID=UPI0022FDC35F|nr:uncharacterized protein EV422DRAFT_335216 [Fimicolochytrium jonesii]KAI8816029.1 hypothetical protein EV422DRAFT_335216 [Fimicolochytrium jonesii]